MSPDHYPKLLPVLEAGLRAEDDTWDKSKVHVSDISSYGTPIEDGGWCPLTLWHRLRGDDARPHTAGELLMFDRGQSLHDRAAELLREGDIEARTGWKIGFVEHHVLNEQAADRLGVLPDPVEDGRLDIELHGGPGGNGLLIIDWKTVRGRAFDYLPQRGPYVTHQTQVRTYGQARDADGCGIVYLDREGQNFGYQSPLIERDDDAVARAAERTQAIAESVTPPPILEPELYRRENKGPDAVYLKEPFQCQRCVFRDHACPGAMKPEHRNLGIVAKIADDGSMETKTDDVEVLDMLERALWRENAERNEQQPVAAGGEA